MENLPTQPNYESPPVSPITNLTFQPPRSKLPIVVFCVLITLLLGATSLLAYQNFQLKKQVSFLPTPIPTTTMISTPSLSPEFTPTISPSPTSETSQAWSTYTSEKIMDFFKTFKLSYPSSWTLSENKRGGNSPELEVTLKKGDFIIKIWQSVGGGSSCLFPEDPQLEGMYARYGSYKEILKENNIVWRRASPEGQTSKVIYGVCEKRSLSGGTFDFVAITEVGSIHLEGPVSNNQILSEFDQILEKIEILN